MHIAITFRNTSSHNDVRLRCTCRCQSPAVLFGRTIVWVEARHWCTDF